MTSIELVTLGEVADLQWGDTSVTKKSYVLTGGKYPAYSASGQDGFLPYFDYDRTGVILSAIGANAGKTWLATGKWSCIKNTIRFFSKDESVADTRYLYWATRSHATFPLRGSAQPFISQGDAREVAISLPPIPEQRAIAATLGALDDKIESNRRAMAKIDELFHAIWRRLYSEIPLEAQIPLSDIVTTQYGLTASASPEVSGGKFLRVTDINKTNWIDWSSVPSVATDNSSRAKYALMKGDLLVARMADPGKSAIYDGGPPSVFASYLVRLKARSLEESLFIYGFLKSADYANYSEGAMTGSVQKNMNAKVIVGAPIKWPASSITSRFAEQAGPLREKICQIAEENAGLAAIRDAVLPGLLSGRIRVPVEGVEA